MIYIVHSSFNGRSPSRERGRRRRERDGMICVKMYENRWLSCTGGECMVFVHGARLLQNAHQNSCFKSCCYLIVQLVKLLKIQWKETLSSYYYLSSVFAVQPKTLRGQNANNKPKTPSNGKNLKPRERDKKQRTEIQSAPMNQNWNLNNRGFLPYKKLRRRQEDIHSSYSV